MAEGPRLLAEIAQLMSIAPFLTLSPRGDNHQVLVMPGFGAGDRSTALIRTFLGSLGYGTHPWKLGTNLGPAMPDLAARLITRLEQIFEANGNQKIRKY